MCFFGSSEASEVWKDTETIPKFYFVLIVLVTIGVGLILQIMKGTAFVKW